MQHCNRVAFYQPDNVDTIFLFGSLHFIGLFCCCLYIVLLFDFIFSILFLIILLLLFKIKSNINYHLFFRTLILGPEPFLLMFFGSYDSSSSSEFKSLLISQNSLLPSLNGPCCCALYQKI